MPKRHAHHARRATAQSNTYRFFVAAESIRGDEALVEDVELAHQINTVLRLAVGDQVVLLDNSGNEYTANLQQLGREHVRASIEGKTATQGEPHTRLTLFLTLMRAERFEWALQKATELGVAAFVPLVSERSMIGDAGDLSERKLERWRKIIREAAEQSRRGRLPELAPVQVFADGCRNAARSDMGLFLWEGTGVQPLRKALATASAKPMSLSIISGPAGGFTEFERETAQSHGIIPVTLGPRILRAETAPIAATAAIFFAMGDME